MVAKIWHFFSKIFGSNFWVYENNSLVDKILKEAAIYSKTGQNPDMYKLNSSQNQQKFAKIGQKDC